jgi:hypothetical protein
MFETADVSTILHEFAGGHLGRRILEDLAEENEDFAVHYENATKWAGAENGWTTEAEEKFARGWERYIRTGTAPIESLRKVFNVLSIALKKVYNTIKGSDIDIKLNKGIKDAFDNLLAYNELNKGKEYNQRIRKAINGFNKKTGIAEGVRVEIEIILSMSHKLFQKELKAHTINC